MSKQTTSAAIVRQIVASVFNIKPWEVKLSGEMPVNGVYDSVSTSGCHYSDSNGCDVYAFTAESGLQRIPKKVTQRMAASNANGTWEDARGVTAEDCWEQFPDAVFFVVVSESSYSDSNGRSEYDYSVELFKAPDMAKRLAELDQDDLFRWEEWINV